MRSGIQKPEEAANSRCYRANLTQKPPFVPLPYLIGLILILAGWTLPGVAADDYLSELAAEVEKVEERAIDAADSGVTQAPSSGTGEADVAREAFERQLKKHYLGSYGFYQKLPERTRQEVFEEYRKGADMDAIRRMIVDRLLHH